MVPPSVGTFAVTELVNDSLGTGGPVTLVAGMFPGSTVPSSTMYSSVVNGRSPSSHVFAVVPFGWCTQALPHESATLSASAEGGAEVGCCGGDSILVGRSLVADPPPLPAAGPPPDPLEPGSCS